MNNEYENEGISFIDLCKVAFGRKILLLIITVSITIIGFFATKVIYNKNKTRVIAEYNYSIVGLDNGEYFDGSKFNYRNLISLSTLELVKESDSNFSNIDVESMYKNDAIVIDRTISGNDNAKETTYKITVYKRYFSSDSQAMNFMNKIAELPYTKTLSLLDTVKYDSYLSGARSSIDYENQIAFLEMQEELLKTNYEQIIEKYGDRTLEDGKKVSDYFNSLTMYIQNKKISNLNALIEENGYVKDYSKVESELLNEQKSLLSEKELNQDKIDALIGTINNLMQKAKDQNVNSVDVTPYNNIISELTIRNVEIEKLLDVIQRKIDNKDQSTAAFDHLINGYQADLENYTTDFIKVQKDVVTNEASVNALNKTPMIQGRIKPVVAIGIFMIAGLFIGGCVNIIIDRKKLIKNDSNLEEENGNN